MTVNLRVIVKHPSQRPEVREIRPGYEAIKVIVGDWFERAMTGPGVHVYCDEDGLRKELPLNLVRPTDGSPIVGTVVVVGTDGYDDRSLTEREVALWMATLAVVGVDDTHTWRAAALEELAPLIHAGDRKMYDQIASKGARP